MKQIEVQCGDSDRGNSISGDADSSDADSGEVIAVRRCGAADSGEALAAEPYG